MASNSWRQVIEDNERKTQYVIAFFVILYVFIGLLGDIVLQSFSRTMSFPQALGALLTFQTTPWCTLSMAAIGVLCVVLTYRFHDKFMLWGTQYVEITPEFLSHRPTQENTYEFAFWMKATQLYNIVEELKIAARLKYMPKVYIIQADFMNAFASGYSENSAILAISEGLIDKLNRSEIQAVMAHELSHIRHMDIKLTLFVGVLTNIMLLAVDALSHVFQSVESRRDDNGSASGNAKLVATIIIFALRIFLPIITLVLTLFLSRTREFMADAGSVQLTRDNESLGSALRKIHADYAAHDYVDEGGNTRKAAYIINPFKSLIETDFMSTHPSLEKRLSAMGIRQEAI